MSYKDPEKRREYRRKYREANRKKLREYAREWKKANPKKVREYYQKYYAAKRGAILAKSTHERIKKLHDFCAERVFARELAGRNIRIQVPG